MPRIFSIGASIMKPTLLAALSMENFFALADFGADEPSASAVAVGASGAPLSPHA